MASSRVVTLDLSVKLIPFVEPFAVSGHPSLLTVKGSNGDHQVEIAWIGFRNPHGCTLFPVNGSVACIRIASNAEPATDPDSDQKIVAAGDIIGQPNGC